MSRTQNTLSHPQMFVHQTNELLGNKASSLLLDGNDTDQMSKVTLIVLPSLIREDGTMELVADWSNHHRTYHNILQCDRNATMNKSEHLSFTSGTTWRAETQLNQPTVPMKLDWPEILRLSGCCQSHWVRSQCSAAAAGVHHLLPSGMSLEQSVGLQH